MKIEAFLSFLEEPWVRSTIGAVGVILLLILVFLLIKHVTNLMSRWLKIDRRVLKPFRMVVNFILILISGLFMMDLFGVGIQGFWSTVSTILALIAIGFVAVWSVLSNYVCAVIILAVKPFQVGDEIAFPGEAVRGHLVDFSFLYTILKDQEGFLFYVPNNQFFQKTYRCRPCPHPPRSLLEQLQADNPAVFD